MKSKLTVKRLDELASVLENDSIGKVALIVGFIKIILALAYVWTRKKLVEEESTVEKQKYEMSKLDKMKNEISQEENFS